ELARRTPAGGGGAARRQADPRFGGRGRCARREGDGSRPAAVLAGVAAARGPPPSEPALRCGYLGIRVHLRVVSTRVRRARASRPRAPGYPTLRLERCLVRTPRRQGAGTRAHARRWSCCPRL